MQPSFRDDHMQGPIGQRLIGPRVAFALIRVFYSSQTILMVAEIVHAFANAKVPLRSSASVIAGAMVAQSDFRK